MGRAHLFLRTSPLNHAELIVRQYIAYCETLNSLYVFKHRIGCKLCCDDQSRKNRSLTECEILRLTPNVNSNYRRARSDMAEKSHRTKRSSSKRITSSEYAVTKSARATQSDEYRLNQLGNTIRINSRETRSNYRIMKEEWESLI